MQVRQRNILLSTLLLSSIIVNIYMFYYIHVQKRNMEYIKTQLWQTQQNEAEINYKLENITLISKMQHYAERKKIKNMTLYTLEGDTLSLQQLVSNENKLVMYFSERGCSMCYETFIENLQLSNIDPMKIIILAEYQEGRSLKIKWKDNSLPVYRITEPLDVLSPNDEYALSFLLNKDMCAENLIVIDKSNTSLTKDYLKIMQKLFSNS